MFWPRAGVFVWVAVLVAGVGCHGPSSSESARTKPADVDGARIVNADREPGNWMTHGRTYSEQRFSPLKQVNDSNVGQLGLAWYYAPLICRELRGIRVLQACASQHACECQPLPSPSLLKMMTSPLLPAEPMDGLRNFCRRRHAKSACLRHPAAAICASIPHSAIRNPHSPFTPNRKPALQQSPSPSTSTAFRC